MKMKESTKKIGSPANGEHYQQVLIYSFSAKLE